MKKRLLAVSVVTIGLFSGCGGSANSVDSINNTSDEQNIPSGSYNLWDYMTPANSHTSRYTILNNGQQSKYNTNYSVKKNRVVEVSDYVRNEKTIYEKYKDRIKIKFEKDNKPNGMYELKLYVNIGDKITIRDSSCKLTKHLDDFELNGKHFNDVIEVKCGNKPGYYQKGVGEIAQVDDPSKKAIRVLSN